VAAGAVLPGGLLLRYAALLDPHTDSSGEEQMKIRGVIISAVSTLLLAATAAHAEGSLSVSRDIELNASAADVWSVVSGFGTWQTWHPAIASTELTGNGITPGDKRVLTLGDGAKVYETLEGYDAKAMSYGYTITESPLPVTNYHSTVKVTTAGDGKAKFTWSSTFDANGVPDADAVNAISGVYQGGIDALAAKYNK
jgi:mxaD protein